VRPGRQADPGQQPVRLGQGIGAVAVAQMLEPIRQTFGFGQINLVLMAAINGSRGISEFIYFNF